MRRLLEAWANRGDSFRLIEKRPAGRSSNCVVSWLDKHCGTYRPMRTPTRFLVGFAAGMAAALVFTSNATAAVTALALALLVSLTWHNTSKDNHS